MSTQSAPKSVVVIGGGIAGIQAALDLANMGFKVHLVERTPSLGGRMAQLDKTFPTNDCAMCILAPKMIEAASHANVKVHAYAEVRAVEGELGRFRVSLAKRSPRVDWEVCTGCGVCEEACPVGLRSEFDLGLGARKAIYIPFAQAVPKKYTIDRREDRQCNAACIATCPIHTNVLGYAKLVADGKYAEAYALIRKTNPLPVTCGRVCFAPCEKSCNRGQLDTPVAIRELKRAATDRVDLDALEPPKVTRNGKRVAIVGAGPAGLAAAHDLALAGHRVTIFEALPQPGGMLYYGIPEFRLPKKMLLQEIDYILKLGVELQTNVRIGEQITLEQLRQDFDAVFVGTGAPKGSNLKVEGEELDGVVDGLRFLRDVALGEEVRAGKNTVIIGGGNTAIDCARTALRLGAETVTIVYRRTRAEMPAAQEEIDAAEAEGTKIDILTAPVKFHGAGGRVTEMECLRMELGPPDKSGRPRPVPIEGSEFSIPVDMVVAAIGQKAVIGFTEESGVKQSRWGTIDADEATGVTNIDGLFAGGDVVTGPAYVIDAIAAGQRAARSIDRYLRGEQPEAAAPAEKAQPLTDEEVAARRERFGEAPRAHGHEEPVAERVADFREVSCGFDEAQARAEAARCLAGLVPGCIECGECERVCEAGAVRYAMQDQQLELEAGVIVLATGVGLYDITSLTEYGYGRVRNVITAMEFERLTSASGPTFGALHRRTADGRIPENIAFIQCVGSRDFRNRAYCSSVCCMHATKEAMLAFEHHPGTKSTIFYMDLRAVGKRFQEYTKRAEREYNVTYVRARPGRIEENPENGNPVIWYEDTETREVKRFETEMVVLCQALEAATDSGGLAQILGIELDHHGFVQAPDKLLNPVDTTRPGVLACGYVHSPRDIPDSVVQASAAAARAAELLTRVG